jgi:hypothetical protein
MATFRPFDAAETSMRKKLNQLFELRAATIELKRKQAEIGKAGNKIFDQFQEDFKASLEVKKTRRAAKKVKPAPAEKN